MLGFAATLSGGLAERLALPAFWVHFAVLLTGIGLARALVRFGTGDSAGENVPAVMQAVARLGGKLSLRPILVKTLAAAVLIGSGGSVGAEGPVAVLGAGTASGTGRWLRFRADRLRLLVGCGAAAGIAGAFGAPIAGLFFAVEKILGGMRTVYVAPLIVASVSAAAVTRTGLGTHGALIQLAPGAPAWRTVDLLFSAVVGMLGGVLAVGYNRAIWIGKDQLARLPLMARITLAAVLVAAIYTLLPTSLLGLGPLDFSNMVGATAGLLLILAAAKIVATSLTLGAAEVGGLFAPAIITGALFGGGISALLKAGGVGTGLDTGGFALLGMAAMVAGSAHAPLTAIFIVLEMSGDWSLILPLLLAGSVSYVVARSLYPDSVYSEWLTRRGERLSHGTDESVLARLNVADALDPAPVTLSADLPLSDALREIAKHPRSDYPVLDAGGRLVAMLTLEDWQRALLDSATTGPRAVREVASPVMDTVAASDSLLLALRRMGTRDAPLLPVVSADDATRLLGVIGRKEVFAAYHAATG
ncbi:MAG: chloride channel protein [Gemmatimonadota bacterium]